MELCEYAGLATWCTATAASGDVAGLGCEDDGPDIVLLVRSSSRSGFARTLEDDRLHSNSYLRQLEHGICSLH